MSKIYVKNGKRSHMYFENGVKVAGNNVVETEESQHIKNALRVGRLEKATKEEFNAAIEANKKVESTASSTSNVVEKVVEKIVTKEVQVNKPLEETLEGKVLLAGLEKGVLETVGGGWIKFGEESLGQSKESAAEKLASDHKLLAEVLAETNKEETDNGGDTE